MTLQLTGWKATVKVVDEAGNMARLYPDVQGADYATALTNLQSFITELDPLTDGLIIGYDLASVYQEDTSLYGASGSEVENIAEIVCPLETAGKYHTFRIPAPSIGIFVDTSGPDKNVVDVTDADVLAFVSLHTNKTGYGTPGADAIVLVSDGEKVKPDNTNDKPYVKAGKRIHRASRKG